MRKTKKLKRIIAIIIGICTIAYMLYAVILLIINPTDIYVITKGELFEDDENVGYIIRNEQVIKDNNNSNGIYTIATEGQKVAKDEIVFRYYKDSEKEITEEMKKIDYQIQELLENENNSIQSSADIKVIENQIEEKLIKLNTLSNYQEIKEYKDNIDSLISKKINYLGEIVQNQEIKELIKKRKENEKQLTNGVQYQKASMSGIVSYRVDGLEDKLTMNNFDEMTDTFLEQLNLKTGQIISSNNDCGKIIDNFKYYIAVVVNSKQADEAKVGDKVTLKISNVEEQQAEIVKINENDGNRTIIFQINKMSENIITYRKVAVDIIWWKKTGYKVLKQAIKTEYVNGNEVNYIIINNSGIPTRTYIKIEKQNDSFAIISSYDSSELKKLGFSDEEIKNNKNISNYDEIIIKP